VTIFFVSKPGTHFQKREGGRDGMVWGREGHIYTLKTDHISSLKEITIKIQLSVTVVLLLFFCSPTPLILSEECIFFSTDLCCNLA
jgi:hypothetical protein